MFLCICNAVTEEEFEEALVETNEIGYAILKTKAGTCCGQCLDEIEKLDKKVKLPIMQM